jgi:hypothetical protein
VGRPTSFDPIETRAALDGGLCEPGAFHRVERSAGAARSLDLPTDRSVFRIEHASRALRLLPELHRDP